MGPAGAPGAVVPRSGGRALPGPTVASAIEVGLKVQVMLAHRWAKRPPPPPPSAWTAKATPFLLAAGCFLLWPGPLWWLLTGEEGAFGIWPLPLVVLLVGGFALALTLSLVGEGVPDRRRLAGLWTAYGLGWLGLLVGWITLPPILAQGAATPTIQGVWVGFVIPQVPTVWAPSAATFGLLLAALRLYLAGQRAVSLTLGAAASLILLSAGALAVQLLWGLEPWVYLLAGAAGIPYLVVGIAWLLPVRVPSALRQSEVPHLPMDGGRLFP